MNGLKMGIVLGLDKQATFSFYSKEHLYIHLVENGQHRVDLIYEEVILKNTINSLNQIQVRDSAQSSMSKITGT